MPLDTSVLNRQQLEAVLHRDGPMLVLAGAGSGKTRVISYRIAHLVDSGVAAENILAVTFTNKAAAEMRERVGHLIGRTARKGLTVSTFHALGHKMLRECAMSLGLDPRFSIFDGGEQIGTLKRIFRDIKIDDRKFEVKRVLAAISKLKNSGIPPSKAPEQEGDDYALVTKEAYQRYEAALRREQAVDFDDLLLRPVRALQERAELRDYYRRKFRYVLVDEYQDTNPIQFEMLTALCDRSGNFCAVGDDDQSIYGFRGAEVKHILNFAKHFDGKEVALTQNYRSSGNILNAANAVIAKNTSRTAKTLWTSFGEGHPVEARAFEDEDAEAKFITDNILRAVHAGERKYSDIAVLYRSNLQSKPFEEALRLEQIPYQVIGGMEYFERKEVKDALAYLRVCDNADDEISLRRIINYPARGIGDVSLEKMDDLAKQQGISLYAMLASPPGELKMAQRDALINLHQLFAATRAKLHSTLVPAELARHTRDLFEQLKLKDHLFEENKDNLTAAARKVDNVEGIALALARFAAAKASEAAEEQDTELAASMHPITQFLSQVSLEGDESDSDEKERGGVTLITIHGSKGLEWPWVFLVGLEEELLPHKRSIEDPGGSDIPEERRLCYVGITRARERLWLTRAAGRKRFGKVIKRTPSRFLDELGDAIQQLGGDETTSSAEDQIKAADDFFAKMREKLGY